MFFSIVFRITKFTCLPRGLSPAYTKHSSNFFVSGISSRISHRRRSFERESSSMDLSWRLSKFVNFLPITAPESIINPSVEMCWTRTAKPSNVKDKRNLWYFGSVFYSSRKLKLLSLIIIFSFIPSLSVNFETFGTFTHKKNRKERRKEGTNAFPGDPRGRNIV